MTGILPQLSDALADTVAKAAPGVVRVSARRRLPASGITWSADSLIVTAHHVVEQDTGITVAIDGARPCRPVWWAGTPGPTSPSCVPRMGS